MFGLSSLECKVNGALLYILSFDKSYRTLDKLTMQFLDRFSQLFENGITEEMFAKTHGIRFVQYSRYEYCRIGYSAFRVYLY